MDRDLLVLIVSRTMLLGLIVMMLWGMTGCSHGLQEVGFAIPDAKDGVHHIVTRDVASSRWTVNQPHAVGQFHCTGKRTSEEMAELRLDGNTHTWYVGCSPASQMPQHQYAVTLDQSNASLAQGPISAALVGVGIGVAGHLVGKGLRNSSDTITQQGGGAQSSSSAQGGAGGNASNMTNSGNTSIKGPSTTNINSGNVFKK